MVAISLSKVQETAPALVSLYKSAGVSLTKHGLDGQRAADNLGPVVRAGFLEDLPALLTRP